jgi:pantetheine-phosphate adenylyltransferase
MYFCSLNRFVVNRIQSPRTAIFPGAFDPFTTGHLALVRRGLALFDRIVVAIGVNVNKKTFFSPDARLAMISRLFAGEPRVETTVYNEMTVDAAARAGAVCILRGARTSADFEYERTVAAANRLLSGIETVILIAEPEKEHISSTIVRELLAWKKPVTDFVPEAMGIDDYLSEN